jgi:hypothetical protein
MTTSNQSKNESLLNFLTSVLKKTEKEEKPNEISILTASVTILASELKQMAETVDLLITAVGNQNKAISDLYTVQEFLLKQLKSDIASVGTEEVSLPSINKTKKEKPN